MLLASLLPLVPIIATFPILPPLGLLMLLGWRLQRQDAIPVWAPPLLGLFDDCLSGQPIGYAMFFWTICYLTIDVLDTRLVWRDFWQNWLIASGAICFVLIMGRLISTPFVAHVDTVLLLQIILSCALFPLVSIFCARVDRDRSRN